MLNVNMDKHPHRINERGMASLETEGRAGGRVGVVWGHGASTSPHLTHECFVELPMTPLV